MRRSAASCCNQHACKSGFLCAWLEPRCLLHGQQALAVDVHFPALLHDLQKITKVRFC